MRSSRSGDRGKWSARMLDAEEVPEPIEDKEPWVSISTVWPRHLLEAAFFTAVAWSLPDKAWACVPCGQPACGSLWQGPALY